MASAGVVAGAIVSSNGGRADADRNGAAVLCAGAAVGTTTGARTTRANVTKLAAGAEGATVGTASETVGATADRSIDFGALVSITRLRRTCASSARRRGCTMAPRTSSDSTSARKTPTLSWLSPPAVEGSPSGSETARTTSLSASSGRRGRRTNSMALCLSESCCGCAPSVKSATRAREVLPPSPSSPSPLSAPAPAPAPAPCAAALPIHAKRGAMGITKKWCSSRATANARRSVSAKPRARRECTLACRLFKSHKYSSAR